MVEQRDSVALAFIVALQRLPATQRAALAQDAILRMPPQRAEFVGRTAIVEFFATVPADGRLDLINLIEVGANGQPALAAYLPDERGDCRGYGIMVLDIADGAIVTITGFPDPALFPAFGLPTTTPATA